MKLTTIFATCTVITMALLAGSCSKKTGKEVALEQSDFSNKAFVQVYNDTVNSTGTTNVYVDALPVTGAAVTYGTAFPATAFGFAVNSGLRSFSIRALSATPVQAPIIFTAQLDARKYYTI